MSFLAAIACALVVNYLVPRSTSRIGERNVERASKLFCCFPLRWGALFNLAWAGSFKGVVS